MMRSPAKIEHGVRCCASTNVLKCTGCPYQTIRRCKEQLMEDVQTYLKNIRQAAARIEEQVKQLEAAQPKWISVEERLPENEKTVLILTKWRHTWWGENRSGVAISAAFHTDGKTFTGYSGFNWTDGTVELEYDEDNDEYVVPEGWWESVRYTEQFAAVDEEVLFWMPLPEPPKE